MIPTAIYYPAINYLISIPLNNYYTLPGAIPCSGGFMVYYLPPVVIQ